MDARSTSRYHEVYAHWQRDPEGFWGEAAREIDWYEPPKKVFDKDQGIYGRWYLNSLLYVAITRRCRAKEPITLPCTSYSSELEMGR